MFKKYLVEFTGSILLVYIILATHNPIAIGAIFGLIIMFTSKISSGYLNPAITIIMSALGRISPSEILPYCLSQVFGGFVALELYKHTIM